MLKNHVFGSFNLNNSEKYRLSFEDIFWGTQDTYTKKMNPPSIVFGGGGARKVCWLIAYCKREMNNEWSTVWSTAESQVKQEHLLY